MMPPLKESNLYDNIQKINHSIDKTFKDGTQGVFKSSRGPPKT